MLNIANYQNAHEYIRDSWIEKRKKNSSFSLRAWSKQLGMASHASLTLILNGKRTIAKKHIPAFIKSLNLSAKEGLYLETLVEFNQAKTQSERELYYERLKELAPSQNVQMFEMESFRMIGNPLHCHLLDMTDLKNFKNDLVSIQNQFIQKVSLKEIEEAIDRLMQLGLLKKTADGNLKKTHHHLSTRPDVNDLGTQEYHKNVSLLASEMLSLQPIQEREYNASSMSIQRSDLPKAKLLLREFAKKFMNEIEVKNGDGEETYQLNLQFFSLTKNHKNETKGRP